MERFASFTKGDKTINVGDKLTNDTGKLMVNVIYELFGENHIGYRYIHIGNLIIEPVDKFFTDNHNYWDTIEPHVHVEGEDGCGCDKNHQD